jgi:prepilin-type N-terminal cleavage/methylation domain-containing protein
LPLPGAMVHLPDGNHVIGYIKKTQYNKGMNHARRAFSLPELLITISIMAILAALAIVDVSRTQRTSRDSRRKSDVQALSAAVTQYVATSGTSFIRYNKQVCSVPTIPTPETYAITITVATGTGCVGAEGRSYGKMNLVYPGTTAGGYGAYSQRTYASDHTMMDALIAGGFLNNHPHDPLTPEGSQTLPVERDYLLIRACSSGWQNFTKTGALFAVWAALEEPASSSDVANTAVLAGGSKAGPISLPGYVYDFAATQAEFDAGSFQGLGYAQGNEPTKIKPNGSCATDS